MGLTRFVLDQFQNLVAAVWRPPQTSGFPKRSWRRSPDCRYAAGVLKAVFLSSVFLSSLGRLGRRSSPVAASRESAAEPIVRRDELRESLTSGGFPRGSGRVELVPPGRTNGGALPSRRYGEQPQRPARSPVRGAMSIALGHETRPSPSGARCSGDYPATAHARPQSLYGRSCLESRLQPVGRANRLKAGLHTHRALSRVHGHTRTHFAPMGLKNIPESGGTPTVFQSGSPGLAPRAYPGKRCRGLDNPTGVVATQGHKAQPRWGCPNRPRPTQGSLRPPWALRRNAVGVGLAERSVNSVGNQKNLTPSVRSRRRPACSPLQCKTQNL
jgi:hypothetical protein